MTMSFQDKGKKKKMNPLTVTVQEKRKNTQGARQKKIKIKIFWRELSWSMIEVFWCLFIEISTNRDADYYPEIFIY